MTIPQIINDGYELVATEKLRVHPRNVNRGKLDAISESIDANGFYGAVVAQRSTGYVLAGNHRLVSAQSAHVPQLPVIYVDVDDDRALRILLADNRTTRLGEDDPEALAKLLAELAGSATGRLGTAYTSDDLDKLIAECSNEPVNFPEITPTVKHVMTIRYDADEETILKSFLDDESSSPIDPKNGGAMILERIKTIVKTNAD